MHVCGILKMSSQDSSNDESGLYVAIVWKRELNHSSLNKASVGYIYRVSTLGS